MLQTSWQALLIHRQRFGAPREANVDAPVAKYARAKHTLRSCHYFYGQFVSGGNLLDVWGLPKSTTRSASYERWTPADASAQDVRLSSVTVT